MSAGDQIVMNVSRGKELAEWMGGCVRGGGRRRQEEAGGGGV